MDKTDADTVTQTMSTADFVLLSGSPYSEKLRAAANNKKKTTPTIVSVFAESRLLRIFQPPHF